MSDEYVEIPGLGRKVLKASLSFTPANTQAPKPQRPTMCRYGFPFGKYLVDGTKFWFQYDPKLMGTKVRKHIEGKWSEQVTRAEVDNAAETVKKSPLDLAVKYGKATGSCAICGKGLRDAESVEFGIGPKCAAEAFGIEL